MYHLKRSKTLYFKERREFFVKVFVNAESYLELSQAFMTKLFCRNSERFSASFAKSFTVDIRMDSKHASEKTGTFKMKLKVGESTRLLKRAAFLVS